MKKIKWFMAPIITVLAGGAMAADITEALQCELQAPKAVKLGEAVALKFKLTNTSSDNLLLLRWNTPLEGWFASPFTVTRDGQWVSYQGAMVKRFRPSHEDYVSLGAGKSISNTVNLAEGYQMDKAGVYEFVFNGRLQDVQALASVDELSSKRTMQTLKCETIKVTVTP